MLDLHHKYFNCICFVAGFICSRAAHSSSWGGVGGGGGGGGAMENIFIKKERTVAMKDCIKKVVTTMTVC